MRSIQSILTRNLLIGVLISLGAASAAVFLATRALVLRVFDSALAARATTLATLTRADSNGAIRIEFSDELMQEFAGAKASACFQLWDHQGRSVERSGGLSAVALPQRCGPVEKPDFWNLAAPHGSPLRAIGIRFPPEVADDSPAGEAAEATNTVTLVVVHKADDMHTTLNIVAAALGGVGLLTFVAIVLAARVATRRGLAPLGRLADFAAGVNTATLSQRFALAGVPQELAPIAAQLNQLLARLEEAFERERRFTSDAAHELRTPIAELRALADYAIAWPQDSEASLASFQEVRSSALRLESLTDSLLTLARYSAGQFSASSEPTAIRALVEELWPALSAKASAKGLEFNLLIPEAIQVQSDRAALALVLRNLLQNAVDHSPPSGSVSITAEIAGGVVRVVVENTTDDLTPDDLNHVFDRFWRKDAARVSGNAGIGLTLARALAAALGFTLTAELVAPNVRFILESRRNEVVMSIPPDSRTSE